jgi:hypothetical protein
LSGNILRLMRTPEEKPAARPIRAAAGAPESEARDPWAADPFAI